jgi:hypothetical protein
VYALRAGESYPVHVFIQADGTLLHFPGMHTLAVQLQR